MSGYTPDEIQAVVEKLVLSTIRRPYDTLGVRRTDISFNDVQEAAAGVFILYPNAPFYVLWLGVQRLGDSIAAEAAIIEALLDAIEATGLNVLPVDDVSPLFNAKAALQELGGAAGKRGGVFSDITKAPAFQRYSDNVQRFLDGPGVSVKNNGTIVMTPQEARSVIPGLMGQLKEAHAELLARVEGIAGGIADYNNVNLPAVVSSSVLGNAAKLVGADADALEALPPTDRLTLIRQTVLNVLATRAVVTTFGSFSGPSDYYTLAGIGLPYSDALRLAEPAEALATKGGGAAIIAGVSDELTLGLDGDAPFTIVLSPSRLAQLDGQTDDSYFLIGDGANPPITGGSPPNNNLLKVKVDGVVYIATLTISVSETAPRTADEVATDINLVLPAGVVAEGYYAPLKFSGGLDIPAGVDQTWTLPVPGSSDLVALGVTPGKDTVRVESGANAGIYPITAVTPDSLTVTGTTVLDPDRAVEAGPLNRRVRIRCNDPAAQLPLETTLQVYSDTDVSKAALETLGFYTGLVSQCLRTTADLVAADISSKTAALEAATEAVNTLESVPARTEVLNPSQVTFAAARALGTQAFAGLTLTMTVTSLTKAGTTKVGHVLVLRSGAQAGQWYTVTSINGSAAADDHVLAVGDVLVATGTLTGDPESGVDLELGPTVTGNKYDVVTVAGGPNSGTYFVQSQGDTPLDIILILSLPLPFVGLAPLDMVVSYGEEVLLLKSIKKTTQSELLITGSASILFFSTSSTSTRGKTPWFQLPSSPRGLQVGDVLETYPTDYKTPAASYALTGVDGKVLALSPSIPCEDTWQFSVQPPPFARLRVGTMNDYGAVKAALETWLAQPPNADGFFTGFNRLVNPLLVNTNPTAVQVGAAQNELKVFYSFLLATEAAALAAPTAQALDSILSAFTVEAVPAVDTLLQTFIEKGSNRAADLLLGGQFTLFFSLTVDGASYAGAFQEAARAVAMNDLPVRRFNRAEAQTSQLIGQAQSPDYEYTAASVNETLQGEQVNPPGNFGEPSSFGKK